MPLLLYIATEQNLMSVVSDRSVGAFGNDPRLDARSVLRRYDSRYCTRAQDITLLLQQGRTHVLLSAGKSHNCLVFLTKTDNANQK